MEQPIDSYAYGKKLRKFSHVVRYTFRVINVYQSLTGMCLLREK